MATIRIYLKEGWRTAITKSLNSQILYIGSFGVEDPSSENPYIHISLDKLNVLPDSIRALAASVSIHANWSSETRRRFGIYEHADARGDLDGFNGNFSLVVTATTIKSAVDLYRNIRAGAIAPKPGGDYDAQQVSAYPTPAHRPNRLMRPVRARPPRFAISS